MKTARWVSLLLFIAAIPAEAQSFGDRFSMTNTRYRAAAGEPRLVTNNRDFFLFWAADNRIRAARVEDGEARISHAVLDIGEAFDVVWTGSRFVVVSTRYSSAEGNRPRVVARLLDAEARPIGAELTLAEGYRPRIAAGPDSLLVLHNTNPSVLRALPLEKNGRPTGEGRALSSGATYWALTSHGDGFLAILGAYDGVRAVKLDRSGASLSESLFPGTASLGRDVAVATDGTRSLAIWSSLHGATAAIVDANGAFGAPLPIEAAAAEKPSAIWNGAGWTVSYAEHTGAVQSHIVHLHWNGQAILGRETSAEGIGTPAVAALGGRELAAWRPLGINTSPSVIALPIAEHEPREAPYAPATQTLLATASAVTGATLTVWSEPIDGGLSVHTGLRDGNGSWTERELMTSNTTVRALAAGDGERFAIAIMTGNTVTRSLFRLDSFGRLLGAAVPLPLTPLVMGSNGTSYALFDDRQGVLVSADGVVSAPVTINHFFQPTAVASNGDGYFLGGEVPNCPFIICAPGQVYGLRLASNLTRIDAQELRFTPDDYSAATLLGAGWNGERYVIAWNDVRDAAVANDGIAFVPADLNAAISVKPIDAAINGQAMAVLNNGTIAIAGRDLPYTPGGMSRVAFFSKDGVELQTFEIEPTGDLQAKPRLEPLANAGVAYIASSSTLDAGPHEGTTRIVTAIARPSNMATLDAPHISVNVHAGTFTVEWSAPAGMVNGYRLEYRIDDDEWVEYEQWFRPGAQRKTIQRPSFGTQFAFRVRAFNDGGASAYSATVVTKPSRRRAVR